jgi:hypothetical protein
MRVLVCGSRDYTDVNHVWNTLEDITTDEGLIDTIIHGGATGADEIAGNWAYENCKCEVYQADWKTHGRAAGPIIAFPGGAGTNNMITRAQKAGVKVIEIT